MDEQNKVPLLDKYNQINSVSQPFSSPIIETNPPPYEDTVITVKQTPASIEKPRDYLFLSIFNAVCCAICLGIPAIVYSTRARKQYRLGNIENGKSHANVARILNITGISCASCIIIIFIVFCIVSFYFISTIRIRG